MPDDKPAEDDGTPTFAEVVQAVTPPGTNWEDWKAALAKARSEASDMTLPPLLKAAMAQGAIPPEVNMGTTCARCDHPHGGPPGPVCLEAEAHLGRSPLRRRPDIQLAAISRPAMPQDPFARMTPGALAATAMHVAFTDLKAGGFTEDQALTFLARAYATFQRGNGKDGSDG